MTDFVIVIAAAAALASPIAPGSTTPAASTAAVPSMPLSAPTVGFRTYADAASCEQATSALVAPAGKRLVCVPVEPMAGELSSAY